MFIIDDILLGVPAITAALHALQRAFSGVSVTDAGADDGGIADASDDDDSVPVPQAAAPTSSGDGTIVYVKGIDKVSSAVRQAILDAASQLSIPVDSLALVIGSESGWNPAALNPLPAAGFIQLTTGANLPGFTTANAIRSITTMDPVAQIQQVVIPFYARFGSKAQGADPGHLYMLNFLPSKAGEPETTVLGVSSSGTGPNGETSSDLLNPNIKGSTLTLGMIYGQNAGFDIGKKGYFTIGDVYDKVRTLLNQSGGRRIDVAGNITTDNSMTAAGPRRQRTAGGCGNWDFPAVCGNWAKWDETYNPIGMNNPGVPDPHSVSPALRTRTAGGPGVPPGFERAREVFTEPDVPDASRTRTVGGRGGGGHGMSGMHMHPQFGPRQWQFGNGGISLSPYPYAWDAPLGVVVLDDGSTIGSASDDTVLRQLILAYLAKTANGPRRRGPVEGWGEVRHAGGPVTATPDQIAIIQRGILPAIQDGLNDPISWTQMTVGEYEIMVTNEPLAVSGLRLPTNENDVIAVAAIMGALPITKVISDARWAQAKQVPAQPLNDPRGAVINDPNQIVAYNQRMGANTGNFVDGYWKEVIVNPTLNQTGPGSMAQYGFKNADGSMYEHGGNSNHDNNYKDYSDTPTYVSRQALKNGASVDLLDEYEAGGSLTPAIPTWLVNRLRGG
jgi:hypothetical protein